MSDDPSLPFDPHPEAWVRTVPLPDGTRAVDHSMSFDHNQGPESEAQLNYWRRRGYPGADKWQIGQPIRVATRQAAAAAMEAARERST
jgi:hypothetical protein